MNRYKYEDGGESLLRGKETSDEVTPGKVIMNVNGAADCLRFCQDVRSFCDTVAGVIEYNLQTET